MNDKKLKVVFVGMPDMALVCLSNMLAKNLNIVAVVPPKKNHETYEYFVRYVKQNKLNLIEFENSCNDKECIEKLKKLNADIGVVCSYNYKLSKEFIETTKMGYINSHPSLLPQYRGAAPYFHIIKNGENTSGITLHFVDEEFDTGDVIYQKEFRLMPNETMGTLFNRTNYMISDALIEILDALEKGEKINRYPQEKNGIFKEAPRVNGDFKIRWNNSVFEIEQLIKACNPFYNAFTFFRGVNLKVLKASAIKVEHEYKLGEIVKADENNILIAAKGGYLSLEVFQLGTWGIFNAKDFYYTFSPKVGEILI